MKKTPKKQEVFSILMQFGTASANEIYKKVSFRYQSGAYDTVKRILDDLVIDQTAHKKKAP